MILLTAAAKRTKAAGNSRALSPDIESLLLGAILTEKSSQHDADLKLCQVHLLESIALADSPREVFESSANYFEFLTAVGPTKQQQDIRAGAAAAGCATSTAEAEQPLPKLQRLRLALQLCAALTAPLQEAAASSSTTSTITCSAHAEGASTFDSSNSTLSVGLASRPRRPVTVSDHLSTLRHSYSMPPVRWQQPALDDFSAAAAADDPPFAMQRSLSCTELVGSKRSISALEAEEELERQEQELRRSLLLVRLSKLLKAASSSAPFSSTLRSRLTAFV